PSSLAARAGLSPRSRRWRRPGSGCRPRRRRWVRRCWSCSRAELHTLRPRLVGLEALFLSLREPGGFPGPQTKIRLCSSPDAKGGASYTKVAIMADDSGRINQVLAETSFLYGGNADFVEDLYARWAQNPESVEPSWRSFFSTLRDRTDEV